MAAPVTKVQKLHVSGTENTYQSPYLPVDPLKSSLL